MKRHEALIEIVSALIITPFMDGLDRNGRVDAADKYIQKIESLPSFEGWDKEKRNAKHYDSCGKIPRRSKST